MIWQLLIFNFFFFLTLSAPISAKRASFRLENNSIELIALDSNSAKKSFPDQFSTQEDEVKTTGAAIYLKRQNKSYLIKEYFVNQEEISIDEYYSLSLPTTEPLAFLSFEYLLESSEDLPKFDEPAFYLSLEDGDSKKIIFAVKLNAENQNNWQEALIDLTSFTTHGKKLLFYSGNLGDELKPTRVRVKNLSANLVLAREDDQLFLEGSENNNLLIEENPDDYLLKLGDRELPYYFLAAAPANLDFSLIEEPDNSLTLWLKSLPSSNWPINYLWRLNCEGEKLLLSQKNHYLLPEFELFSFFAEQNGELLVNFANFNCQNLAALELERF